MSATMWRGIYLRPGMPGEGWLATVRRQKLAWAGLRWENLDAHSVYVTRPRPDQLDRIHETVRARQGEATMLLAPLNEPLELLRLNPLCRRVVQESTQNFATYRGEPPTEPQCVTLCPLGRALGRSCCRWSEPDADSRRSLIPDTQAEYNRWALSWQTPELDLWPPRPMLDALARAEQHLLGVPS